MKMRIKPSIVDVIEDDGMWLELSTMTYYDKDSLEPIDEHEVDLEKACDAYCKVCGHYAHTTPVHICRQACDYYKDFKQAMKDEMENQKESV